MRKIKQETPIEIDVNTDISILDQYAKFQKITFTCIECGCKYTTENRCFNGVLKCKGCKLSESKKSYSEEKKKSILEKSKKTCLEKYGVEKFVNTEKTRQTCLERYGVDNLFKSPEIQEKRKQTLIEKYGDENYVNKDKTKKTMFEKYGGYTWQSDILREKCDKTLRKRYGKKLEKIVEKSRNTKKEKYGDENFNNCELHKHTCLEKYGVDSYSKTDEYSTSKIKKYTYDNMNFDSSWELYIWIYAKDHNIEIVKEPIRLTYYCDGKEHFYFPDFLYGGKLIEIKGGQFLEDGNLINPYDRNTDKIYNAKYQCIIDNNVELITDISFAKDYVDEKYTKDYVKLFLNKLDFPYLNKSLKDKSDMGLIHHFHKSIYDASVYNRISPINAWKDKNIIKKVALNRLKYIGKCRPSDILQGFNVMKIAPKVSVFNPNLASDIIKKYIDESTIFDPFSGFSGRMIGSFRNNKEYIGQDINDEHIKESIEIRDYLNYKCKLNVQDITTDIKKTFTDTCLFTCPPYEDKEKWNDNDISLTCDEWIDICIDKYKCDKYLFVVDNTSKYVDYVVETINNKSHFGENKELIILIENI